MHEPAAAVLAPAVALISEPYLGLAVIGALVVIVHETRSLLRRLFSRPASSASQRAAKLSSLRSVAESLRDVQRVGVKSDATAVTEWAVPSDDRIAVRPLAPAIAAHAGGREQLLERVRLGDAPPSYLLKEAVTEGPAGMSASDDSLVREVSVPWIEHDSGPDDAATTDPATGHPTRVTARQVTLPDGRLIELRAMSGDDRVPMIAFARALPPSTRLVLKADVRDPAAIDAWISSIESGSTLTTVTYAGNRLVGYASLVRGAAPWTSDMGEISIVVASDCPTIELGQSLAREIAAAPRNIGLRKIVAALTADQADARTIFADLGLSPVALLADQVIDEQDRPHDVLIMSCRVDALVASPPDLLALAGGDAETAATQEEDPTAPAATAARPAEPVQVAASAWDAIDAPSSAISADESTDSASPVLLPRRPGRRAPTRRAYLAVAASAAVLMLALGTYYFFARTSAGTRESHVLGESVQPPEPIRSSNPPPFESTRAGSGGVFLPLARQSSTVQVSVDPGTVGTWFWCLESSVGIPLAAHDCGSSGNSTPPTGELTAQGVIHIDPSLPADALYFVQMYCEGPCVWHVKVASQ